MPESDVHARFREGAAADEEIATATAETMQALSTPSRVRLLYALQESDLSVGELAERAGLTPAATSQQLRVLRHLKLVVSRREGQSVRYALHDHHVAVLLDEIRNHVEHALRGWGDRGPARGRRTRSASPR